MQVGARVLDDDDDDESSSPIVHDPKRKVVAHLIAADHKPN